MSFKNINLRVLKSFPSLCDIGFPGDLCFLTVSEKAKITQEHKLRVFGF
jgi:hypothetical protein